jgi:predicted RNA methylase
MMARPGRRTRQEFGDFQTPRELADAVCALVARDLPAPAAILEPTCGTGSFLLAALDAFPAAEKVIGIEINADYVDELRAALRRHPSAKKVSIDNESFFNVDWLTLRSALGEPVLIIGNPPWVTNSALAVLGSDNVPVKSNFQRFDGLDAITGKSNFDIAEYMIRHLLDQFVATPATIALLCKTAVARKVLSYAWTADLPVSGAAIYRIDAAAEFGAAVDACLFVVSTGQATMRNCPIYPSLSGLQPESLIGFETGEVVANISLFDRWKKLTGASPYQWRSGIKHDCSKVMELRRNGHGLVNGFDERVDVEEEFLFPLLKTSDVANGQVERDDRFMLVPQRSVGEDTAGIRDKAPKTWRYLESHASELDARASSIYRKRSRFSIFGVGPYTFAPWKVAISALYKRLHFVSVGPLRGKPRVFDDTTYFVPCESEDEARLLARLLNSEPATEFFAARIFWDSKRPITVDLLSKLNISALADALGVQQELPNPNGLQFSGIRAPSS